MHQAAPAPWQGPALEPELRAATSTEPPLLQVSKKSHAYLREAFWNRTTTSFTTDISAGYEAAIAAKREEVRCGWGKRGAGQLRLGGGPLQQVASGGVPLANAAGGKQG